MGPCSAAAPTEDVRPRATWGRRELRAPSLQWGPHQKRSGVGNPSGSRPATGREAHLGAGRPQPSPTFSPVPGSAQAFADHLLSSGVSLAGL